MSAAVPASIADADRIGRGGAGQPKTDRDDAFGRGRSRVELAEKFGQRLRSVRADGA